MSDDFQKRNRDWMLTCFGDDITNDETERAFRFAEESMELVQTFGVSAEEMHVLVDYVFGRPVGERPSEAGAVMVCLAALCTMSGLDMMGVAEAELARVSTPEMIKKIRTKHASKPKNIRSPKPGVYPEADSSSSEGS